MSLLYRINGTIWIDGISVIRCSTAEKQHDQSLSSGVLTRDYFVRYEPACLIGFEL